MPYETKMPLTKPGVQLGHLWDGLSVPDKFNFGVCPTKSKYLSNKIKIFVQLNHNIVQQNQLLSNLQYNISYNCIRI